MRLDATLTSADLEWLTRRSEKMAYLQARAAPESAVRPVEATVQDGAGMASQTGIEPGHTVALNHCEIPGHGGA